MRARAPRTQLRELFLAGLKDTLTCRSNQELPVCTPAATGEGAIVSMHKERWSDTLIEIKVMASEDHGHRRHLVSTCLKTPSVRGETDLTRRLTLLATSSKWPSNMQDTGLHYPLDAPCSHGEPCKAD